MTRDLTPAANSGLNRNLRSTARRSFEVEFAAAGAGNGTTLAHLTPVARLATGQWVVWSGVVPAAATIASNPERIIRGFVYNPGGPGVTTKDAATAVGSVMFEGDVYLDEVNDPYSNATNLRTSALLAPAGVPELRELGIIVYDI